MNNGIAIRMIHHLCVCVRNARASDVCNCGHNQNKTQNHAASARGKFRMYIWKCASCINC